MILPGSTTSGCTPCKIVFLYARSTTDSSSSAYYIHSRVTSGGHLGPLRSVPPASAQHTHLMRNDCSSASDWSYWHSVVFLWHFSRTGYTYTHIQTLRLWKSVLETPARNTASTGECSVASTLAWRTMVLCDCSVRAKAESTCDLYGSFVSQFV